MVEHPDITVLYVDDEKENLLVFKANFSTKFQVITSPGPKLALQELDVHHNEIIAVISDMRMPIMNGVEFIKKAREKYQNIVYFILTGYAHNDEVEEALEQNVIRQLFVKPFDVEEIERAILDAAEKMSA